MKIWIFSDLYLEHEKVDLPLRLPDADVCVVAGDVLTNGVVPSLEWLAANVAPTMPVIFVAGNHEFYRGFLIDSLTDARAFDGGDNLHFLEDGAIEVGDTVFCGASLLTDFDILGNEWAELAMRQATASLNDYRSIRHRKQPFEKLWPIHTYNKHVRSRAYLEECIRTYEGGKLVFVTHHAPSILSVDETYLKDLLTPSYASDLTPLMGEGGPQLWVHGHMHRKLDYMVKNTRVICNPRGYPGEPSHVDFDFGLVINL